MKVATRWWGVEWWCGGDLIGVVGCGMWEMRRSTREAG